MIQTGRDQIRDPARGVSDSVWPVSVRRRRQRARGAADESAPRDGSGRRLCGRDAPGRRARPAHAGLTHPPTLSHGSGAQAAVWQEG